MTGIEQKKIFSNNLNNLLEQNQLTQREVANSIGVSPQTFNTWCKGIAIPRMDKIQKLADYFNVGKSALIDVQTNTTPSYEAAAGEGRIGDGYPTGEANLRVDEDQVVVTVRGRSMEPTLMDGDQVIVEPTSVPEDHSKIYLVKVNGEEHTLKRVEKKEDGLVLIGDNMAEYAPRLFTAKEVKETPVTIEGVVVRLVRDM